MFPWRRARVVHFGKVGEDVLGQLVRVRWQDAESVDEWTNIDALKGRELTYVETIGHLIRDDDLVIICGSKIEGHEDYACTMVIPKGMVISKEPLEIAEPTAAPALTTSVVVPKT